MDDDAADLILSPIAKDVIMRKNERARRRAQRKPAFEESDTDSSDSDAFEAKIKAAGPSKHIGSDGADESFQRPDAEPIRPMRPDEDIPKESSKPIFHDINLDVSDDEKEAVEHPFPDFNDSNHDVIVINSQEDGPDVDNDDIAIPTGPTDGEEKHDQARVAMAPSRGPVWPKPKSVLITESKRPAKSSRPRPVLKPRKPTKSKPSSRKPFQSMSLHSWLSTGSKSRVKEKTKPVSSPASLPSLTKRDERRSLACDAFSIAAFAQAWDSFGSVSSPQMPKRANAPKPVVFMPPPSFEELLNKSGDINALCTFSPTEKWVDPVVQVDEEVADSLPSIAIEDRIDDSIPIDGVGIDSNTLEKETCADQTEPGQTVVEVRPVAESNDDPNAPPSKAPEEDVNALSSSPAVEPPMGESKTAPAQKDKKRRRP